jgi:hypothetical protein
MNLMLNELLDLFDEEGGGFDSDKKISDEDC